MGAIDRIAQDTGSSRNSLLSGVINLAFQVGSGNVGAENGIAVTTRSDFLSSNLGFSSLNQSTIASALDALDAAPAWVILVVGEIEASASRIDFASGNLATIIENLDGSHSAIRDADMAFEMSNLTGNQILL